LEALSTPDRTRARGPDLDRALEVFWHPVCTLGELAAVAPQPLAVTLLGRRLAIADLGPAGAAQPAAFIDRCAHRSTRLSVGWTEPGDEAACGTLRCAYHGWRFGADGRCVDIPALDGAPIPPRARVETFDTKVGYGLVWTRIDPSAGTDLPAHPAYDDPSMRCLEGTPYTWPTSAPRRVENFVDLSHFAWVHDGTLGRRDKPVVPVPDVRRVNGELRFSFDPPSMDAEETALFGHSRYRMPMPCSVDIEFFLSSGARRRLWMTASPIDATSCRTFWSVARDDDLDGDDTAYLAFQQVVLDEDEPVVCNQDPAEMQLDPAFEVSVRTDRVSIEYRRYLRDLAYAVIPQRERNVRAI
jgi:phenylpropionate dioxygenase-like ring-hydroxylating dioxygenase large terminal subunit